MMIELEEVYLKPKSSSDSRKNMSAGTELLLAAADSADSVVTVPSVVEATSPL